MKTIIIAILIAMLSFIVVISPAQIKDPVKWNYAIKKVTDKSFKIYVRAKLESGWHIYAQKQPKNAIGTPTQITFANYTGFKLVGAPSEVGHKESQKVEELDVIQYYYSKQVDFVQEIVAQQSYASAISCKVSYMACNDKECLPVTERTFTIQVK